VSQFAAQKTYSYNNVMRTTMNLSLPPDLREFVNEQMKSGGYGTASEYVRDMLRRARERQLRRQIDEMLIEAVESGASIPVDDADWASLRKAALGGKIKRRHKKR